MLTVECRNLIITCFPCFIWVVYWPLLSVALTIFRPDTIVQLAATKRNWMRVPNLKFWSARQRGGWKKTCDAQVYIEWLEIEQVSITTISRLDKKCLWLTHLLYIWSLQSLISIREFSFLIARSTTRCLEVNMLWLDLASPNSADQKTIAQAADQSNSWAYLDVDHDRNLAVGNVSWLRPFNRSLKDGMGYTRYAEANKKPRK